MRIEASEQKQYLEDFGVKRVMLDGVVQRDLCMADDEQGIIERAVRDENGHFRFDSDGWILRETVRGRVTIVMRNG